MDLDRCYLAAMRILNYRFNSEAELRRKLRAKDFETGVIDATIERLRRERWLDDARFAAALVRTRARKCVGPRRIARELTAAGVDGEVASRALQENADPEAERAAARSLAEKRLRILDRRGTSGDGELRNKLTAYLLNQGYDPALVREVLRVILSRADGEGSRAT